MGVGLLRTLGLPLGSADFCFDIRLGVGSVTDHPAQASSGFCKINTVCNTWPHRGRTLSRTQTSRGPMTEIQCLEPGQASPEVNQTREDQSHRTDLRAPLLCHGDTSHRPTPPTSQMPFCREAGREEGKPGEHHLEE